jgi:hypothetical protein
MLEPTETLIRSRAFFHINNEERGARTYFWIEQFVRGRYIMCMSCQLLIVKGLLDVQAKQ